MNLFGNMSMNHSSLPVLLVIYNLPPDVHEAKIHDVVYDDIRSKKTRK